MLLQALNEFYGRATRDGLIQEAAFTGKFIRWNIPLKLDGSLEGIGLTENVEIKKGGRAFSVPRTGRAKNGGDVAEFLWEGLETIFSLQSDLENPSRHHGQEDVLLQHAAIDHHQRQTTNHQPWQRRGLRV